jgi:FkbM family methyltransferase
VGFKLPRKRLFLLKRIRKRLQVYVCATLVYDGWERLVFTKLNSKIATLRIKKTNLDIVVTKNDIKNVLLLSWCLRNLNYEECKGEIRVFVSQNFTELVKPSELLKDKRALRWFEWLAYLRNHSTQVFKVGNVLLVKIDGLKWHVRPYSEDIRLGPLLGHEFERYEYENWFKNILKKGSVFVDIGANVGGYSLRAAALGAQVYALEPNHETYKVLKRNAEINDLSLNAYNLAAGHFKGVARLYSESGREGKASLIPYASASKVESVNVVTLDDLFSSEIKTIDLLKIDVEGSELDVLKGSQEVLSKCKYVMIEVRDQSVLRFLGLKNFKLKDVGSNFGNAFNVLFKG